MSLSFRTNNKHGYSVKFSPYLPNRLACATSQHYGIAGSGTIFFLDITPQGIIPVRIYNWNDGLFDVTWSENNEHLAVSASGDGSLQIWDVAQEQGPIKVLKEHEKEVYGVDWSQTRNIHFVLSASWDRTIKMWDVTRNQSLSTFLGHEGVVYSAVWSPRIPGCFASTSGDNTLRIWDMRRPQAPQIVIPAHSGEVLCCDWCKYDQNVLITGSVDAKVHGFDLRKARTPVFELVGHQYAVKRAKFSPFQKNIVVTSSYDFTVRTWDILRQPSQLECFEHHTEFVYGMDMNIHMAGQVADCAWDETIRVYTPRSTVPPQELR